MTRTTDPTTRMADTNTLSAPVALREILRGAASAADASWIGRVVTWFSLARRSVERAGKRQKCQEITETNGPGRVNGGRTAPPAFANFAAPPGPGAVPPQRVTAVLQRSPPPSAGCRTRCPRG